MRVEVESLLGACRKTSGDRYYYDCPNCTTKDPRGQLVVNWKENKFICNHVSSCGFAGTIDKSLTYILGIKRKTTHIQEVKVKTKYELNEVKPVETKGTSVEQTKPIDKPRSDKLFGDRFALVAYPDKETMNMVRKNWKKYGFR